MIKDRLLARSRKSPSRSRRNHDLQEFPFEYYGVSAEPRATRGPAFRGTTRSDPRSEQGCLHNRQFQLSRREACRACPDCNEKRRPAVCGSFNPCGVEWLLYAYARVRGATAYPGLLRMLENPRLSRLNREIEIAMDGSMELTSVITSRDKVDHLYGQTQQLGGLPPFIIPQQA